MRGAPLMGVKGSVGSMDEHGAMNMLAMRLHAFHEPLRADRVPVPEAGPRELLLAVRACGVCRTDLHLVDGELEGAVLPIVPGHEIVGEVVARGAGAERFALGARVGVPWLGASCGHCGFCHAARENLCDDPRFTGLHRDGGYAQFTAAREDFCFAIPAGYDDAHAAPLLCAGLIGYRALSMTQDARRLGLYGFGAAAHLVAQVAIRQGREVFAFTRPGDTASREFALRLGCAWAGDSTTRSPEELDAAVIFAPVGSLVPAALASLRKGGVVVCAGIHMSDIPSFPYSLLWGERVVRSVANLTRRDGEEFLQLVSRVPVETVIRTFALEDANAALSALRHGELEGAAVLVPPQ
jgi:propanol-preferring alcohol dehydrogenase